MTSEWASDWLLASCHKAHPKMACLCLLQSSDMNFEVVAVPFHSAEVTGIDCCIRKPLIASASPDHSVRLWNYHDKWVPRYGQLAW